MQSWVALPDRYEEINPTLFHHDASELPTMEAAGVSVKLIAGSLYGLVSPVKTYSEMFYVDVELATGARTSIPTEHEERAAFIVEGTVAFPSDNVPFPAGDG